MLATRVGYAGGDQPDPTYHALGDHREAIEVTYDPRRTSYRELLDVFWNGQPLNLPPDPNPRVHLAVMPRGEHQRAAVDVSRRRLGRLRRAAMAVEVIDEPRFWAAEAHHQKFYLQRGHPRLVDELAADFPSREAFLASTAAARLNAWLTPMGDDADLDAAAQALGRDPEVLRRRLESR